MPTYNTSTNASGQDQLVQQFRSNGRFGRADFQLRNLGRTTLIIKLVEVNAAGAEVLLGAAVTIAAGGIQTISCSSQRTVLRLKTDSTNIGSGLLCVLVNYLGQGFQGQLTIDDSLTGVGQGISPWPPTNGAWPSVDGVVNLNGSSQ